MKQLYTQTQEANSNRHDSFLGSAATVQPFGGARRSARMPSLFPVRNKGKGPPGWAPAPEAVYSLPAAASAGSENSNSSFKKNNSTHNQLTNIKSLSIMKKQILILVLAILGSVTVTWAQMAVDPSKLSEAPTYCAPATPIEATCVPASGPLNPIAGTEYNYSATVTNGGAATIHWFVTAEEKFIDGGVLTDEIEVAATSNYVMATGDTYNTPGNTTNNVDITWKSFPSATPVFLVTYVKNEDGCTDNIKVYKIQPVHVFTLDIAALTFDGKENTAKSHCVSPVQSAQFNGTNVLMDYGLNYIYFTVNAANYAHSWKPTFDLTATNTTATTTLAVDWAYPSESYGADPDWHSTTNVDNIYTSVDVVAPVTAGATGVGADGECIVVRVTVDHNQNETLADVVVTLAVNGIMYDQVGDNYTNALLGDIHFKAGTEAGQDCPWFDGYTNDRVVYTLTRRPTVADETDPDPADNFIPNNAD